jgi:shikimate kinase
VTPRVVLVGLPGVGKSTVGGALALEFGVEFVDLDDAICARCGAPPAALLRSGGERAFRELETDALAAVLTREEGVVVATGGGTVESGVARALLAGEPLVVWLTAPHATLLERLVGVDRPLLEDPSAASLASLAARRDAWYAEVADATVDASGTLDGVVGAVVSLVVRA